MSPDDKALVYRYTFTLSSGDRKVFEVRLDPATLSLLPAGDASEPPPWTRLEHETCEGCPLVASRARRCPLAVGVAPVVEAFADILSYHKTDVLVESRERSVQKTDVPVQDALYPLVGLYMVASGCPVMDKLKPLARHHLPFSTVDETLYRVLGMYLIAQHLRRKEGLAADWDLKQLPRIYSDIQKVNVGFCRRLYSAVTQDAVLNSVAILDLFGSAVQAPPPRRAAALRKLFAPFFPEGGSKTG